MFTFGPKFLHESGNHPHNQSQSDICGKVSCDTVSQKSIHMNLIYIIKFNKMHAFLNSKSYNLKNQSKSFFCGMEPYCVITQRSLLLILFGNKKHTCLLGFSVLFYPLILHTVLLLFLIIKPRLDPSLVIVVQNIVLQYHRDSYSYICVIKLNFIKFLLLALNSEMVEL